MKWPVGVLANVDVHAHDHRQRQSCIATRSFGGVSAHNFATPFDGRGGATLWNWEQTCNKFGKPWDPLFPTTVKFFTNAIHGFIVFTYVPNTFATLNGLSKCNV